MNYSTTINFQLLHKCVNGQAFVAAARARIGATCEDVGHCAGFILLVLWDVGLLPLNTDVNQAHLSKEQKLPQLWHLLLINSTEIPLSAPLDLQTGDLFLSAWRDEKPQAEIHHINIWTGWNGSPFGYQMQCLAVEHGGTGFIREVPLNAMDWARIERVYRLKAITGGDV